MALGKGLNSVKKLLTENENGGNQSVCQVSQMFYRVLHFLAEINKKTPPAALMAGARRACGRGGAQDEGRVYLLISSVHTHTSAGELLIQSMYTHHAGRATSIHQYTIHKHACINMPTQHTHVQRRTTHTHNAGEPDSELKPSISEMP